VTIGANSAETTQTALAETVIHICIHFVCIYFYTYIYSEAVLGVWLPAPLPTPRALPDHRALWPLAVGVEKDLGGIDV